MNYWLVKSEPHKYSWEKFNQDGRTFWDGVRNYQARNNLRDMKEGDLVLFYHSNEGKDVVGIAKVARESYAAFSLGGQSYSITATHTDPNDPQSDLMVATVSQTLTSWAPLYTGSGEAGKTAEIFGGRGRQQGSPVMPGGVLHGWNVIDAPPADGKLSLANDTIDLAETSLSYGSFIEWNFNAQAGSTTLTDADSGGAVFILDDDNTWKLAGINYGISSPYATDAAGDGQFTATLFDQSGYFVNVGTPSSPQWNAADGPGFSAATRVSAQSEWVSQFPEPASLSLLAVGSLLTLRRRSR